MNKNPRFPRRKTPRFLRSQRLLPLLAGLSLASALHVSAATVNFTRISSNSPTDYASAFTLIVTEEGGDVVFRQSMASAPPGFITQVYFEDTAGLFSGITFSSTLSSDDLTAISYTSGATPPKPPGTSNTFDVDHSFDPVSPSPTFGINNDETGAFLATYNLGMTSAQVEAALLNGDLRIALHVQGLDPNGSESDTFVSQPPGDPRITSDPPIPEPSALLLGILTLGMCTRRRR